MDTTWMEKLLVRKISVWLYGLLGGAAAMFVVAALTADQDQLMFFLIALAYVALIYGLNYPHKRKYDKWLNSVIQSGNLPAMMQDFDCAYALMGGDVRMGRYWMFGKYANRAFAYGEIVRVYQYIHRTNFIEDTRQLKAVCTDGKEHILCDLPKRGKGDAELNRIVGIMLTNNPGIQVGYH